MASNVSGNVKNTSSRFEWIIPTSRVNKTNFGGFLDSPTFMGPTIQYYVRLYPKGVKNFGGTAYMYKQYFLFYLYIDGAISAFTSPFKIINDKGEDISDNLSQVPSFAGVKCVSRHFVAHLANGIFQSGNMKFSFEVTSRVTFPPSKNQNIKGKNATKQQVENVILSRLEAIDKYGALLTNGKFSDVSLIAEGKTMKVHKCILAQSSPVFAAMFDAEMKEKQEKVVEIPDIEYDVLLEMIRFVYVGKVNNIDTLAGELAVAADKYALNGLKKTCEKTMIKNLNHENVIRCVQFADRLRMAELKKQSMEFIVEHASGITDKTEFDLLPNDVLRQVCRCLAKKK